MNPERVDEAARALAAARTGQPIAALPEGARPATEADSYAIQEAVLRRLGERIGGYKVGLSPEGGIFCAPIYASKVHASPASLPARGFHLIGIECEIGFRLNQALAQRAKPYSRDEVLTAASLHPTIEIVDSRYQDFRSLDQLQVLADIFRTVPSCMARRHPAGRGWISRIRRLRLPPTVNRSRSAPGCAPATRSVCWSSS
jgi:2-keto-4-pentenoate hydratase